MMAKKDFCQHLDRHSFICTDQRETTVCWINIPISIRVSVKALAIGIMFKLHVLHWICLRATALIKLIRIYFPFRFYCSARLLVAIRTEITDNVEITTEKNGKQQIDFDIPLELLTKYAQFSHSTWNLIE